MKDKEKKDKEKDDPEEQTGVDRRSFLGGAGALAVGTLAGLSGLGTNMMANAAAGGPVVEWGPRVDLAGLRDNFAPQEVEPFTVQPGGIDNLGLHSVDVFEIPGQGSFEVEFNGFFRVARANPSSFVWGEPTIRVNILELRMSGQHPKLGEIHASLNPDVLASGQIFSRMASATEKADPVAEQPVACRIAVGAVFTVPAISTSLFNKEPILLMNSNLTKIPPVDDPNGHAMLFKLPLFSVSAPHAEPVAFLTSLRYGADHYLTREEVRAIRERPRPQSA
jgi:hypothetical protein